MSRTLDYYMSLEQPSDAIQVTYVWIGGSGQDLRCKTRTVSKVPQSAKDLPEWGICDMHYTMNNGGISIEFYVRPVALYRDPFRGGNNKLVLCDVYTVDGKPFVSNFRANCNETITKLANHAPWFGFEQEYFIMDKHTKAGYKWRANGYPEGQGAHFNGVGDVNGRAIAEAHYRACLYAGVKVFGDCAELLPSQWEFQTGPTEGIKAADDLWMSRFILERVAEDFDALISFDPKPVPGPMVGSGCHTNVSTVETRKPGGIKAIEQFIEKFRHTHADHIRAYDPNNGQDNRRRMDGCQYAPNLEEFGAGVGDRTGSIRIPEKVNEEGTGYFEDRRPSSNCDPYRVIGQLMKTMYTD